MAANKSVKWNEVTWYSKAGTLIVFIGVMPTMYWFVETQCLLTLKSQEEMQASLSAALMRPPFPAHHYATSSAEYR